MNKPNPLTLATTLAISILLISTAFSVTVTQAADPNENDWQLEITGLVNQPLNLTLNELTAMPPTSVNAGIYCVDFPYKVVESGNWTGIKLSYLLETAGISPSGIGPLCASPGTLDDSSCSPGPGKLCGSFIKDDPFDPCRYIPPLLL